MRQYFENIAKYCVSTYFEISTILRQKKSYTITMYWKYCFEILLFRKSFKKIVTIFRLKYFQNLLKIPKILWHYQIENIENIVRASFSFFPINWINMFKIF